jgi:hypothetical protein
MRGLALTLRLIAGGARSAAEHEPGLRRPSKRGRILLMSACAVFLATLRPGDGYAKTPVAWVELVGPGGQASIRVIVDKDAGCPTLMADGEPLAMRVRAEPGPLLREGKPPPPADFPVRVCGPRAAGKARAVGRPTAANAAGRHSPHCRLRRHRMSDQRTEKAAKLRQARQMALRARGRACRASPPRSGDSCRRLSLSRKMRCRGLCGGSGRIWVEGLGRRFFHAVGEAVCCRALDHGPGQS